MLRTHNTEVNEFERHFFFALSRNQHALYYLRFFYYYYYYYYYYYCHFLFIYFFVFQLL